MRHLQLILAQLCALCTTPLAQVSGENAVAALLGRFKAHDVVILGESPHQGQRIHEFIHLVISNPEFTEHVTDVMVEFGNARCQEMMDRYLLGLEDVPRDELALAWRDTTQLLVWDSPVYEAFFTRMRTLNATLEAPKRIRVLLGDPPIDWSKVHTAKELDPWLDREPSYLQVLEQEVLNKGRKALVLIGASHCFELSPRNEFAPELTRHSWLGQLLESNHPGRSSTIYSIFGREALSPYADTEAWRAPTWIDLRTHPMGEASFGLVSPQLGVKRKVKGVDTWVPLEVDGWPSMQVMVDALLYLGEESVDDMLVAPLPETYQDKAYGKELMRRAQLLDELFSFAYYVPTLTALQAPPADSGSGTTGE